MSISTWAATTGNWEDSKFSQPWAGPLITPSVGSLTLSSSVPISTSGIMRTPGNGSLTLTGQIPISTTGVKISPDTGTLTLSTTAPEVIKYLLTYVDSASLTLTGQDVTAMTGHIITPAAASLTGLGAGAIWSGTSATWAAYSGNWNTGSLSPTAGVTYTFTIDSAGDLVLTPYDPISPMVTDPKFIATVTLI